MRSRKRIPTEAVVLRTPRFNEAGSVRSRKLPWAPGRGLPGARFNEAGSVRSRKLDVRRPGRGRAPSLQ